MRPGRYYVVMACWGRGALVGYRGQPAVAPQDLRVGSYVGGASYTASAEPPAELALATDTHDYFARLRLSDGEALTADTRRSYSGPFEPGRNGKARGNLYAVDSDTWLTGLRSALQRRTRRLPRRGPSGTSTAALARPRA